MELSSIVRLAPGCRLHGAEPLLLVPEGTLELTETAREVLSRLDGKRTVAAIIDLLLAEYDGADRAEIEPDVVALLDRMQQRGVLRSV